jgi:hypothetical protein
MAGLSSIGEADVLVPLTDNVFVSLHLADPGDTGANEVVGGAYARQGPVTFANTGFNPTVAANTAILTYPQASASYGMINFFGIWTAVTGGNFLGSGAIGFPIPINTGDSARFYANSLTISVE